MRINKVQSKDKILIFANKIMTKNIITEEQQF